MYLDFWIFVYWMTLCCAGGMVERFAWKIVSLRCVMQNSWDELRSLHRNLLSVCSLVLCFRELLLLCLNIVNTLPLESLCHQIMSFKIKPVLTRLAQIVKVTNSESYMKKDLSLRDTVRDLYWPWDLGPFKDQIEITQTIIMTA